MSVIAPKDWSVGELLTAANMNAQLRDNMKWLVGADGVGTSFPGSPIDGQPYTYVADSANGVYWAFRWRAANTYWAFVGGAPLQAIVATSEATTSATYTDLSTAGPSIIVPRAGDYDVQFGCKLINDTAFNDSYMSVKPGSGATSDADAILYDADQSNNQGKFGSGPVRFTGLSAADTLKAQYRVNGGTGTFVNRRINVWPVKVA